MPVTEEDVRRAYYANAGAPQSWWITELQMNPPALIVADQDSGKLYRVPYQIEGDAITFAAAAPIAAYSEVAAARATGPVVVYASAEESRTVAAETWAWEGDWGDDEAGAGEGDELYGALYPGDPYDPVAAGAGDGEPEVPGFHGPVHAEHEHSHRDYAGGLHTHPHVHRGDGRHAPGAGHGHGVELPSPLAAGIAASRAEQIAADPNGTAALSDDEIFGLLFPGES